MGETTMIRLAAAVALTLLAAPPLAAKPADYAAAVADSHRSEANRKLDESRMPAAVLDFAGYKPGDVVADYQAGGGYYTELIAAAVGPKGRVFALTQPNFYKAEEWTALTKAHPNVATL